MTGLEPSKRMDLQLFKGFAKFLAILITLLLITGTFTFFKPINIESIGYQFYNDRTYRVEKTNQITDLLHGELLIRRQVKKIKSQESDPHRQIDLALSWVTQYVRPQDASPSPVISDDYYNILKRGSGYCDQAAYVFSVLSHRLGIPARMIMLRDRDGVSHHTAAEVYLDDKWQYIDPWLGVWPHRSNGSSYTRFEFAADKSAQKRLGYASWLSPYEFAHSFIFETFPFMSFENLIKKVTNKLWNLHEASAENQDGLSNFTQNANFGSKFDSKEGLTDLQIKVLEIYDQARSLHLEENFQEARVVYKQLIKNSELSSLSDSARFFYGVTYFDQHLYADAEKYFKNEIRTHPNDLWINSEYRFLAEILVLRGSATEAKSWLEKSSSHGAQSRLDNLDESLLIGINVPFISY